MIEQIWSDAPMFVVWILLFFAIEAPALLNAKRGDTLSEMLRYVFGFTTRAGDVQSTGMKVRRLSFYAASAWFVLHINGTL
jgi:hypothetical protein